MTTQSQTKIQIQMRNQKKSSQARSKIKFYHYLQHWSKPKLIQLFLSVLVQNIAHKKSYSQFSHSQMKKQPSSKGLLTFQIQQCHFRIKYKLVNLKSIQKVRTLLIGIISTFGTTKTQIQNKKAIPPISLSCFSFYQNCYNLLGEVPTRIKSLNS